MTHVIKSSKTTDFAHSNHPLLVIGLQQSNQNLKYLKENKNLYPDTEVYPHPPSISSSKENFNVLSQIE